MRTACPVLVLCLAGPVLLAAGGTASIPAEKRAVQLADIDHLRLAGVETAMLDVRAMDVYLEGHLPPARPLDVDRLADLVLVPSGPDTAGILRLMERIPLRASRPVLVYAAATAERRDGYAAWLLSYAGFPRVEVIDGGFGAWYRRRNLGVFQGYPVPAGSSMLRPADLHPRPGIRVDPSAVDAELAAGAAVVEILPAGSASPAAGTIRVDELLDDKGFFLFPLPIEKLLSSRDIDPGARLILRGPVHPASFAWVGLVANGFDAALIH
ncbi:MAG: rhodanese-like domain-containing protein, partial [Acidobacteriota bacterium]